MNLADIIEEIIERTSSTLTMQSLIRKVNAVQREIFRIVKEETTSRYDLEADQPAYPIDYAKSAIMAVFVENTEYAFMPLTADSDCKFYTIVDSSIILSPCPTKDVSDGLVIFHHKVPYELTVNDMNREPDIDADYRMLLVYGVCADISDDAKHVVQYGDLLKAFKRRPQNPGLVNFSVER